ncbi:MAG: sigma-54 dependent transcriptional regulator [Magnetospirillum sp. WYHS-4]
MRHADAFDQLFVGNSPELQAVLRAARLAAAVDVAVLIQGESGTGKELLAQAIHRESRRAARPLVTINCAALPSELVESELFGHRKGAFTGAGTSHPGRVRAADGGTLFLDEIGELPLEAQGKLLRFLDSGEVQAVGDTRPARADVRLVAATNRDLHDLVDGGLFRADLYYRLNVVPFTLPPLRERTGDLALLIQVFAQRAAARHGNEAPRFTPEALAMLSRHGWPGNLRELRNLCERMAVLRAGIPVRPEDLPPEMRGREAGAPGLALGLPESGISLVSVERDMIRMALEKAGGNRSRAARLLGLTRDTLLYRIKKHAIQA